MELKNFYTQDTQGNILPGAQVYVYLRGTSTLVGGLQDASGAAKPNPFPSDDNGLATFAVANGRYDVRVVDGERDSKLPMQFFDVDDGLAAVGVLVQQAQTAATSAQEADASTQTKVDNFAAELLDDTGAGGAGEVGWDGLTVSDVLATARPIPDVPTLRTYSGIANTIRLKRLGVFENYYLDTTDTTSADDGALVIVDGQGRRWKRKLRGAVTPEMFGAVGDNVTDDTAAVKSAAAYLRSVGGGMLKLAKIYAVTAVLALSPTALGWHNIDIVGTGMGSSGFNFQGAAAGTEALQVLGWGGRCNLRDFAVLNSKGVGVNFNPVNRGSANWVSRCSVYNLRVEGSASDGIRYTQTYMFDHTGVESRNNVGYGFHLRGFHTSMDYRRCWAGGDAVYPNGGNQAGGFNINGLVYSTIGSCGADGNGGPGYTGKALSGVIWTGSGAEVNAGAGWLFLSDTDNTDNIPTPEINAVELAGCFATGNGTGNAATPNFIEVRTAGTSKARIVLSACGEVLAAGKTVSIVAAGAGGEISIEENNCDIRGTRVKSGKVFYRIPSNQGRSTLLSLSVNAAIPNAVETVIPFNTVQGANSMEGTISGGGIRIPKGINRVRISTAAFWNTSSVGSRVLTLYKNNVSFFGGPTQKNAGVGFTGQSVNSSIIEVSEGDIITAIAYQDSGAALAVIANANTYLSIEALG